MEISMTSKRSKAKWKTNNFFRLTQQFTTEILKFVFIEVLHWKFKFKNTDLENLKLKISIITRKLTKHLLLRLIWDVFTKMEICWERY